MKSEIIDLTDSPCSAENNEDQELQIAIYLSTLPSSACIPPLNMCQRQYYPGHFLNQGSLKVIQSNYDVLDEDKINFDDILQVDAGLLDCVLSSYVIDEEWLISKLLKVPNVTIALHNGDRNQQTMRSRLGKINIVYCKFPSFPSYGVMHCKIMILRYRSNILRIVISTGNLAPYDYGHVQNMVFVEDLSLLADDGYSGGSSQPSRKRPLDSSGSASASGTSSRCLAEETAVVDNNSFKSDFMRLLQEMGLIGSRDCDDGLITLLNRYDWTRVKAKLVYSIPGTSYDYDKGSGLMMLRRKVMELKKDWTNGHEYQLDSMECQGSSLGNMDEAWLSDVLQSCTTNSPREHLNVRSVIKVVFPTMSYATEGGVDNFGTIFCRRLHWENKKFPRSLFHRCESLYGSHQPLHSKTILCQYKHKANDHQSNKGWLYVGSHNFTASAWGKYIKDKQGIMVCNYEVGVLLPLEAIGDMKLPYKRSPLTKYSASDVPWMQGEEH